MNQSEINSTETDSIRGLIIERLVAQGLGPVPTRLVDEIVGGMSHPIRQIVARATTPKAWAHASARLASKMMDETSATPASY